MHKQPFRYNSGLIRASALPFFEGDGSASQSPLVDRRGNPIGSGKVRNIQSIYQTDWQGRRILSPYPRTNLCANSSNVSGWWKNGAGSLTVTAGALDAPNGDALTATLIECTGGSTTYGVYDVGTATNVMAGELLYYYVHAKAYSGTPNLRMSLEGSAFTSNSIGTFDLNTGQNLTAARLVAYEANALANGWWRLMIAAAAQVDGNINLTLYSGTTDASGHYLWGVHLAREPGGYIPTGASPVTVTDWTLNDNQITFGQAPTVGALLDWTGVAFR